MIKDFLDENAPALLLIGASLSFATSVVLAVKATPGAKEEYDDFVNYKVDGDDPVKEAVDIVKTVGPYYVGAATTFVLGVSLLVGSHRISTQRMASLGVLYGATDRALDGWKRAAKQKLSADAFDELQQEVLKPIREPEETIIVADGSGDVLVYDPYSDRYFYTNSIETIRKATNDVNVGIRDVGFVPVNSFYADIGLSTVPWGNDIGWVMEDVSVNIDPVAVISENDDIVVVLDMKIEPKHTNDRFGRM